jgi:hypothetical protein
MSNKAFKVIAVTAFALVAQFAYATTNEAEQTDWSPEGECLPNDESRHIRWKYQTGSIAVAEWNWSFSLPKSYYLKNLWWDPFMILEKEVTW